MRTTPETRYAKRGDLHIAYQVVGEGPLDILLLDQWFSHQEAQWDFAPLAAFRERLATFGRLILFDKTGTGLSDPVPTSTLPTIEEWMADVPAVLDAVGSERAAVVANIGGGVMGISFAAANPDRTSALILVDCFARFLVADDFPFGAPPEAIVPALEEAASRTGQGIMVDLFAPSLADDPRIRQGWSRYERQAASPGATAATVRLLYNTDVRALLPEIRTPTLVIHRRDATGFRVEHGRYLAEHIPGARLVELPGIDNLIWAGDQEAMASEIQAFLTGTRPALKTERVLATVLFTDIVDSTRHAAEIGDSRWRAVLGDHYRDVRRQLDRFGGHEVKTVGDGILATFDGPGRALRCAVAIRDDAASLGIQIRAGLHTGEIEIEPEDIAGLAVHIGARIVALAGAGQILTSGTVRDLVAGSDIVFEEQGRFQLKGVPGEWQLYAADLR